MSFELWAGSGRRGSIMILSRYSSKRLDVSALNWFVLHQYSGRHHTTEKSPNMETQERILILGYEIENPIWAELEKEL